MKKYDVTSDSLDINAYAVILDPGHGPIAVELDLVQPVVADRSFGDVATSETKSGSVAMAKAPVLRGINNGSWGVEGLPASATGESGEGSLDDGQGWNHAIARQLGGERRSFICRFTQDRVERLAHESSRDLNTHRNKEPLCHPA